MEPHGLTEQQTKRARRVYYGAVSYIDNCVGGVVRPDSYTIM